MEEQTIGLCPGVYLGGGLSFLQDTALDPKGPHLRLCFGYVGWEKEQLQQEVLQETWFPFEGSAKHIFELSPQKIWRTTLKEMGDKYAMLSMLPEDPSLN